MRDEPTCLASCESIIAERDGTAEEQGHLSRTKLSTGKNGRTPGKRSGSNQKLAHSLVALSSAAVLAVYTAGYLRTRSAAERFVVDGAQRRTAGPAEASPMALPAAPE